MTSSNLSELSSNFLSLQSCLIFAVVSLIIYRLFTRENYVNLPPGPSSLPFIGNVHKLGGAQMHVVTAKLSAEFGRGLMTVDFAGTKAVIVTSLKAAREAFVEKADLFSDRYQHPLAEYINGIKGSLVLENGDGWKSHRRTTLKALRDFGMGKRGLEDKINEEVRYLARSFEKENGRPFYPQPNVQNAVANVICSITLGRRYEYDDPEFRRVLNFTKMFSEKISGPSPLVVFPRLWFTPFYNALRNQNGEFISFLRKVVEKHKETFDSIDIRDIIDVHLQADTEANGSEEKLPQTLIWRSMVDLFLGGTDTTSSAVLWAILILTQYPHVQEKVQREIDDVIGRERPPTMSDRSLMPYLDATLMETQRFRPAGAFVLPKVSSVDTELMGYTIPKGMQVWNNLYAILHSPEHWRNPDDFIPERFLSADEKKTEKPEAFIPFGIGRRICIAEQLARMELFLSMTNLLQRFSFKIPEEDHTPNLEGHNGITFSPGQFRICAVSR